MTVVMARAAALLTLVCVLAATVAPLFGTPPGWSAMPASVCMLLFLLALSVTALTTRALPRARQLAAAAAALAALTLLSWAVIQLAGPERVLAAVPASSVAGRLLAAQPTAATAFAVLLFGASIWLRHPRRESFDGSALLGTLAAALLFLLALAQLYGATELSVAPARLAASAGPLGALLLFALGLTALALHPGGPLAVYSGDDPGAVAKRRLLPAAVLTPMASGFLLVFALNSQRLSPTLAVALTVFANVLVMLLLIDGVGNKVTRVARDRQARVEAREAQARRQNLRDPMTALLNRRGWDAEIQAAERRCRSEGLNACVLVVDLDGLKHVNDTEGHKAGDAYIRRAAHALRQAARGGDALARLGGDEFAFLVVGCDEAGAQAVVRRFEEALLSKGVSASVGYAMRQRRSLQQAFEEADRAMYEQKRQRKLRRA